MMFQVSTNKAMSPKSLHHLFPKLVKYFGMPPSVFCCFRYILSFPLLSWVKMVVFQNHPCLRMASRRAAGRWIRFAFCAVTTLSLQVVHSVKQRLTRAWKMAKTWWSPKSAYWGVQYWQLSTHHFHLSVSLSMSSLRPTKDELCEKAVARIELADDTAMKRSIHSMTQVTWKHDSSVSFHLPNSHLWFQKKTLPNGSPHESCWIEHLAWPCAQIHQPCSCKVQARSSCPELFQLSLGSFVVF